MITEEITLGTRLNTTLYTYIPTPICVGGFNGTKNCFKYRLDTYIVWKIVWILQTLYTNKMKHYWTNNVYNHRRGSITRGCEYHSRGMCWPSKRYEWLDRLVVYELLDWLTAYGLLGWLTIPCIGQTQEKNRMHVTFVIGGSPETGVQQSMDGKQAVSSDCPSPDHRFERTNYHTRHTRTASLLYVTWLSFGKPSERLLAHTRPPAILRWALCTLFVATNLVMNIRPGYDAKELTMINYKKEVRSKIM